jgi:hypothetical protein
MSKHQKVADQTLVVTRGRVDAALAATRDCRGSHLSPAWIADFLAALNVTVVADAGPAVTDGWESTTAHRDRRRREDADELRLRLDSELSVKWCWGSGCSDTDWGGKGRRHMRGAECTPRSDSPLTQPTDPRLTVTAEGEDRG